MKDRVKIYLPVILALALMAGLLLGYWLNPGQMTGSDLLPFGRGRYDKLNDIVNYVQNEYVDSVSRLEITEEAIDGILGHLDPHSRYFKPENFNEINDPLIGQFEGIGIEFRMVEDTITVIQTIPGGPSEKAGILPGDRIVLVNDSLMAGEGITSRDVMKMLKGKRGTAVKISVSRRGMDELIDFTLIRDVIPTHSIDAWFMVTGSTGYIKLSKFSATTWDEFRDASDELLDMGMKNLILDLRGNSGGYMNEAIRIADEFLEKEKLILYTEGYNRPRNYFYATSAGDNEETGLAVLIDEYSASASEIIAGAIQDNDRGVIIGRRSFGKGLVQEQLDFADGSALRLTVARYHTPTGRSIQKPYDPEKGFDDYYSEPYNRYVNGEMENADSVMINDSLRYETPGGRIVYGGGGIMPDIYIPVETDERFGYYNRILKRSLPLRFSFNYTTENRNELDQFESVSEFKNHFTVDERLFREFIAFADRNGVEPDEADIRFVRDKIENLIKAYLARSLFGNHGFYAIYLKTDKPFQTALEQFE